jgi:hypothetical protein
MIGKAIQPRSKAPCQDFKVEQFTTKYPWPKGKDNKFEVEHIVEVQTFKLFLVDAQKGVLNTGPAMQSCGFMARGIGKDIMIGARPAMSGLRSAKPYVRLYETLGSKLFRDRFWLVHLPINRMKALVSVVSSFQRSLPLTATQIWAGDDPIAQPIIEAQAKNDPSCFFKSIKTVSWNSTKQ